MANAFDQPAHVMVVDDAAFERLMLVDLLSEAGYHVTSANTGTQAYELAKTDLPDLILLDAKMPDLDGFACCRLLQASPATSGIPVIFLSGADSPLERVTGLMAGAVDYITKPFDSEELLVRIGIHLRLAQRHGPAKGFSAEDGDADAVLLTAAKRVIAENIGNLPGLTEIAHRVGTYREKLNQLFRARVGCSVFEYVRELRVERATTLLRDTEMEVRDIAQLVGFQNAGNFATAFKDRTGYTPTAFRSALHRRVPASVDQRTGAGQGRG
ncbi:response regulator transcription factor [Pseudoduganella lutea]|uniref:Response regulator n=1 Tax=Pseudoduganella lutea TaxID=321985 RepID=A0A4P6L2Y3_9BURK|nr:DNA-binding response regulator [Pseudoduganella lutea]QBE65797.1 response regulator [Pseudoduganella lutea]